MISASGPLAGNTAGLSSKADLSPRPVRGHNNGGFAGAEVVAGDGGALLTTGWRGRFVDGVCTVSEIAMDGA